LTKVDRESRFKRRITNQEAVAFVGCIDMTQTGDE
jgi:hypothetical protein